MPTFSFWLLLGFHLPAVFSERRRIQDCSSIFANSCEVKDATKSCDFAWGGSSVYKCDESGNWRPENSVQTCGSVVDTAGLLAVSNCASSENGDQCTVSCRPGYEGETKDYICRNGVWTFLESPLECSPVTCGSLNFAYAENACSHFTYQSICVTTCEAGYVGDSQQYVCGENGTWDSFGDEMECVPVDCGNQLPSIDATCDGPTSYGQAACNFQCNNFERSQLYICTQSGEWFPIGESLDCRHCPSFSSLFSTDSIQTQCENTAIDSECSATCGSGFQGDERQYVCSENGTWEPKDQPLVCTSECGSIIGPSSTTSSICTIDGNYFHNTDVLPSCTQDNVSTTTLPSVTCPPLNYLPYAESECSGLFQSTCIATCEAGYAGIAKEYVCNENGNWQALNGEIQCAPLDCGNRLPGIDATCDGPTLYGQAACQFECDFSENSQRYVCMQTGEWFPIGDPLDCRHCEPFNEVFSDFEVDCPFTAINSECIASCGEGFEGNEVSYVCAASGYWEPVNQGKPLICSSACGSLIGLSISPSSACAYDGTFVPGSASLPSCAASTNAPVGVSDKECNSSSSGFETWQVGLLCLGTFLLGMCLGACYCLPENGRSGKATYYAPTKEMEMAPPPTPAMGGRIPDDQIDNRRSPDRSSSIRREASPQRVPRRKPLGRSSSLRRENSHQFPEYCNVQGCRYSLSPEPAPSRNGLNKKRFPHDRTDSAPDPRTGKHKFRI